MHLPKKILLLFVIGLSTSITNGQTLEISGLPINIGDSVSQVQQAMQTSAIPSAYESNVNPNGKRLPFNSRGVFVFFDATGKVAIVRLEKAFLGDINGLKFGDPLSSVTDRFGTPHFRNVTKEGVETLTYDFETRVNFEYNSEKQLNVIFLRKSKNITTTSSAIHQATVAASVPATQLNTPEKTISTDNSQRISQQNTEAINTSEQKNNAAISTSHTSPTAPLVASTTIAPPLVQTQKNEITTKANNPFKLVLFVNGNNNPAQSQTLEHKRASLNLHLMPLFHKMNIPFKVVALKVGDDFQTTVIKAGFITQASHIIQLQVPKAMVKTYSRFGVTQSESVGIYTVTVSVFDVAAQKVIYSYTAENDSKGLFLGISNPDAAKAIFDDMRSKGLF